MVSDDDGARGPDDREGPGGASEAADGSPTDPPGGDDPPEHGWHGEPPEGWDEEDDGNVFGQAPGEADQPVEPGSPRLENAAFVLLGALLALLVVADLVGLL